ncbi:MAG: hypothetical protein C4538_11570 [Nitrospiraceae bacterium]|nr:MAG: hypothetical protein C4538_11570 [Nitrospiraceae bacterium]
MKTKNKDNSFAYIFSNEKLREFKDMPIKARLQWLEEANAFINKALGFRKRARFDERFKGLGKRR